MTTKKKITLSVILAIVALAAFFLFRRGEPPMDLEGGRGEESVRNTKLIDMNQETRTYDVTYPTHGLSSRATVSFRSGALREEVFSKRWKVVYEYDDQFSEHLGIPVSFTIYGYSYFSGKYDRLIRRYRLAGTQPNLMLYQSESGRKKEIDTTYFRVAESLMDMRPGF